VVRFRAGCRRCATEFVVRFRNAAASLPEVWRDGRAAPPN
jgi:hypothetical protein